MNHAGPAWTWPDFGPPGTIAHDDLSELTMKIPGEENETCSHI